MSEWISVEDRLPHSGDTVLVFLVKPNTIGNYDVAKFLRDEIDGTITWKVPYIEWATVTHWMPFYKNEESKP